MDVGETTAIVTLGGGGTPAQESPVITHNTTLMFTGCLQLFLCYSTLKILVKKLTVVLKDIELASSLVV